MKVLILENCFASGRPLTAGDVVELSDNDAAVLRSMGNATADKDRVAAAEASGSKSKRAAGKTGSEPAAV